MDRSEEHMHWVEADDTQALLASIVESSVDAIVGVRLDGTVTVWNPGAERIYGWSATEMMGSPIQRIVPEDLVPELEFLLEQVAAGDVVRELITRRVRKDGVTIDVSLSVSPIAAKDGRVVGAVKTERDVTRRRRQDAIADGQRRLLESLTRTGRLPLGLKALLESLTGLTKGEIRAAVMQVEPERSMLQLAASRLPVELEQELSAGVPIAPGGHPAGEAAFSGQAVSARDLRKKSNWRADAAVDAGLLSCCSTPIVAPSGEVLGTLDLYSEKVGDPATENLEVVNALAQTASLVMDRFRTFEELRSRRSTLAALNKINASLSVELETGPILRRVADEGVRVLGAQMGAFFYSPTGGGRLGFQTHVVAGERRAAFRKLDPPTATLLLGQTMHGKTTQRFDDVTKDPRFGRSEPHFGLPPGHPPIRSFLAVPVISRANDLIGILLFGHEDAGVFGRRHEEVIRGMASQSALALDNARLYEQAKERAEAMALADRRKDEFLAILGHELRNPLSAIAASMELISDVLPEGEESQTLGAILRRQVRHMGRLVDDLLDMGRITRGEIPLKRRVQDVRTPVRRAVENARSAAARSNVTIQLDAPEDTCWAHVDEVRMEQIVGNLIHNAVKFAPDSDVRVRIECAENTVLITVHDDGRGIETSQLGEIFDFFTQVHADQAGGLGLGLSLVQQLVRIHGGSVSAASEGLGKGATFEVRLPVAEAPDEPPMEDTAEVAVPVEPGRGMRVLLTEDQDDAARAMTMLLERWGHTVVHASTGAEALRLADARHPDVAILDIGLPDMDGWDVARELRARDWSSHLHIASLTGLGQTNDLEQSAAAGVDRHFVKPVNPPELRAWLDAL